MIIIAINPSSPPPWCDLACSQPQPFTSPCLPLTSPACQHLHLVTRDYQREHLLREFQVLSRPRQSSVYFYMYRLCV